MAEKEGAEQKKGKGKQVALMIGLVLVVFVLLVIFYLTKINAVEFTYQGY